MSTKLSRRRFLTEVACLGTALLGAAWLAPRPFFERFLEDQESIKTATPPVDTTETAGPVGEPPLRPVDVTRAYPSDSDSDRYNVTCAYPSDSDSDLLLETSPAGQRREEVHSLQPFFTRLLS